MYIKIIMQIGKYFTIHVEPQLTIFYPCFNLSTILEFDNIGLNHNTKTMIKP